MTGSDKAGEGKPATGIAGFLVLDKPAGLSSMQAIARVRHRAGKIKTGHAGTLDPLATGVLVVALGRAATRHIDRFMATTKRYRTCVDLGAFTTTDDREGERAEVAVTTRPDAGVIRAALDRFIGEIEQRPPAFSAVKVGGRRAYALARQGSAPELPARLVTIHSIDLLRYEWPIAELEVFCEKGVYIRSLARDLGEALGTGGHCATLRRTAVGPFDEASARTLDELPDRITQDDLIAPDDALAMITDVRPSDR